MSIYDFEFKLKVVKDYLKGNLGYRLLAKKYGMPSKSPIVNWVRFYKEFGDEGLHRKHSKKVYPVQFKLDVLNFKKQTGASYADTASAFKMNNPSMIANWQRKLLEEGIEGLLEKPKGRPSMSKKHQPKQRAQDNGLSREELLERENEILRLEVAYLKKLKAFQKDPDAFLEKHKQRWHSNSKKKDSN
jgi:transposase